MKATDFTRHDCQLGNKRRSYETLRREWRCSDCGGRLGERWTDSDEQYPEDWHIECLVCGRVDFIHERQLARQKVEAAEVIAGLPPELASQLGHKPLPKRESGVVFSLAQHSVEI